MHKQVRVEKKNIDLLILLGVLVLASFFVLADRLVQVTEARPQTVMELAMASLTMPGNTDLLQTGQAETARIEAGQAGTTQAEAAQAEAVQAENVQSEADQIGGTQTESGSVSSAIQPQNAASASGAFAASPGTVVSDDKLAWSAETSVDIFRVSYVNGEGQITVAGENNDKVIAPGTANTYSFFLSNTGNVALDYQMTVRAYFDSDGYQIPVEGRFCDDQGICLSDDEGGWVSIQALNGIEDEAVLGAGCYAGYTLEWQWPFEGDDQYDTFLGNLAEGEETTLTVVISAVVTTDEDPNATGGLPQTGDDTDQKGWNAGIILPQTGDHGQPVVWIVLMALAFAVLLVLLFRKRRKEEEPEDGQAG